MPVDRFYAWIAAHLPRMAASLGAPASEHRIAAAETELGVVFPPALRALYARHDGQREPYRGGPFYGLSFLSLDAVSHQWAGWARMVDDGTAAELEKAPSSMRSHAPGLVKPRYANRAWIPFADDSGGNCLGLDFDPDVDGRAGQVINFGRDEDVKYVLADSFEGFLEWLVDEWESGNHRVDVDEDGEEIFSTRHPPSEHFLDAVKVMFD